jgi:hypothetical protein
MHVGQGLAYHGGMATQATTQEAHAMTATTTRVTKLTGMNVRALREVFGADGETNVIAELTATTCTFHGDPHHVLDQLSTTMQNLPGRGHPRHSLHAVVRKVQAQAQEYDASQAAVDFVKDAGGFENAITGLLTGSLALPPDPQQPQGDGFVVGGYTEKPRRARKGQRTGAWPPAQPCTQCGGHHVLPAGCNGEGESPVTAPAATASTTTTQEGSTMTTTTKTRKASTKPTPDPKAAAQRVAKQVAKATTPTPRNAKGQIQSKGKAAAKPTQRQQRAAAKKAAEQAVRDAKAKSAAKKATAAGKAAPKATPKKAVATKADTGKRDAAIIKAYVGGATFTEAGHANGVSGGTARRVVRLAGAVRK